MIPLIDKLTFPLGLLNMKLQVESHIKLKKTFLVESSWKFLKLIEPFPVSIEKSLAIL